MDGKKTPSEEPTWQFKPGETVSPRAQTSVTTDKPVAPQPTVPDPVPQPVQPVPPSPPVAQPETAPEPATTLSQSTPADVPAPPAPSNQPQNDYSDSGESLTWTASEFIAHDKSAGWHLGLIVAAILAAAVLWFITRDLVTAFVVIVAGVVLSLYGGRRPGEIQYQLDDYGIVIGQKHFSFNDFKAFSVVPEGAFASIALLPTKRFAPMTTLYFAPDDGDKILGILGDHLPEQPMKADAIDSLMRKIRF